MLEQYTFAFYILYSLLLTVQVNCATTTTEDPDSFGPHETDTPRPTYDVDDVLKMDYGKYTTVSFHYAVHQMKNFKTSESCYDDYIKCLVNHTVPMPVCAFFSIYTYKTVNSYCEVYFENCRITYRYYRIVGYGQCRISSGREELVDHY